jgi:hypothetical protein
MAKYHIVLPILKVGMNPTWFLAPSQRGVTAMALLFFVLAIQILHGDLSYYLAFTGYFIQIGQGFVQGLTLDVPVFLLEPSMPG